MTDLAILANQLFDLVTSTLARPPPSVLPVATVHSLPSAAIVQQLPVATVHQLYYSKLLFARDDAATCLLCKVTVLDQYSDSAHSTNNSLQ